jgi:hypothetical protein
MQESIKQYLKKQLQLAGSGRWEAIALAAGVAKSLPRKVVYETQRNYGVDTIQPLYDYLRAVERGEQQLPEPTAQPHQAA